MVAEDWTFWDFAKKRKMILKEINYEENNIHTYCVADLHNLSNKLQTEG